MSQRVIDPGMAQCPVQFHGEALQIPNFFSVRSLRSATDYSGVQGIRPTQRSRRWPVRLLMTSAAESSDIALRTRHLTWSALDGAIAYPGALSKARAVTTNLVARELNRDVLIRAGAH